MQSVLHIAARKGSVQLLRLLLEHADVGGVRAADTSGDTPVDVAKKNGHMEAVAEFGRVWPPAMHGLRWPAGNAHGDMHGAGTMQCGSFVVKGVQSGEGVACRVSSAEDAPTGRGRVRTGRAHVLNHILANRML